MIIALYELYKRLFNIGKKVYFQSQVEAGIIQASESIIIDSFV